MRLPILVSKPSTIVAATTEDSSISNCISNGTLGKRPAAHRASKPPSRPSSRESILDFGPAISATTQALLPRCLSVGHCAYHVKRAGHILINALSEGGG